MRGEARHLDDVPPSWVRDERGTVMPAPSHAAPFTYPEVGATPGELPLGYQHLHAHRVVGQGRPLFEQCAQTLLSWGVQRRAGLMVVGHEQVTEGAQVRLGQGALTPVLGHAEPRTVRVRARSGAARLLIDVDDVTRFLSWQVDDGGSTCAEGSGL